MTKKVIYLFGAGATQAVIKDIDPEKSLMTWDIQNFIENNYSRYGIEDRIWNELITAGRDIEHLISVLESQYNYSTVEKLRGYYSKALVELAKEVAISNPITLYTVLSDLHLNIQDFNEELICFITLNYEDILERSIKKHLKCQIDYGIETATPITNGKKISVIKLHGSFNWTNSHPIQVKSMVTLINKKGKILWIPPGVEKRKDNYPFNLLWGRAKELLMNCDVLRIVGCSLSHNDWGLIPILYTVQKFTDKAIDIEIIDYVPTGEKIRDNYNYLNVKIITELDELRSSYLRKFPDAADEGITKEMERKFRDQKSNPFKEWLDAKIEDLFENNIKISQTSFAYKFYHKTT